MVYRWWFRRIDPWQLHISICSLLCYANVHLGDKRLTLKSNVGAGESRSRCTKLSLDQRGECLDIRTLDLHTLDRRDSSCARVDSVGALELVQHSVEELVGHDEDEEGSVLDDVFQVRDGGEVFGEGNVGKVTGVLVSSVDDIGEFLSVHLRVSVVLRLLRGRVFP